MPPPSSQDSTATYTSFIAGTWRQSAGSCMVNRENPGHTASTAARWCPATDADGRAALDSAVAAFPGWAAVPVPERSRLLAGLLARVEAQAGPLAGLITRENGKPRRDAASEVASGLADSRHALAECARLGLSEPASAPGAAVGSEMLLEPVGPCLLVTPWNFPLATILRKLVPALLYGNPVIVKPSELTPGPACRLFSLLAEAGLPAGVASLVLGYGPEIGASLAGHPAVRAISFTGSTAAGTSLARLTAGRDVRLQLEMGGKNSLLVLADADVPAAVEAAVTGGFSCAGQWCTGTGRVIVARAVCDEFLAGLTARVARLRTGPGDLAESDVGPVISATRVTFARTTVANAVAAGARLCCGGQTPPGGHFFTPAVLADVTETMAAFTDELFVPVLPVTAARDDDDAVRLANLGSYGLSASVFSRDVDRAAALARRLEAGLVHVNLHTAYREPALPVAAWRDSGRGLPECGRFSRDFFTRPRALYLRRP